MGVGKGFLNKNVPELVRHLFDLSLNSHFPCSTYPLEEKNTVNTEKPCISQWTLATQNMQEKEYENPRAFPFLLYQTRVQTSPAFQPHPLYFTA